MKIELHR